MGAVISAVKTQYKIAILLLFRSHKMIFFPKGADLPSPSGATCVSIVGVGLEPSSGLRVRKKRKETTIIEVNTIYSPQLLNVWDLHMARPIAQKIKWLRTRGLQERKYSCEKHRDN